MRPASRRRRRAASPREVLRSTTVLAVVRGGRIAMASDGQVTIGGTVVKGTAQKVRRSAEASALIGFAGGAADALALSERLEARLGAHRGNVPGAVGRWSGAGIASCAGWRRCCWWQPVS
jgi:20S proteasome alpha/beta subunit